MSAPPFLIFLVIFIKPIPTWLTQWCIPLILYNLPDDERGLQRNCMGSTDRKISDCSIPYKPYHLGIHRPSFPIFHSLEWLEGYKDFFHGHKMFRMDILHYIQFLWIYCYTLSPQLYYQNSYILYQTLIPLWRWPWHGSSSQIPFLHLSYHKQSWLQSPCGSRPQCIGSHWRSLKIVETRIEVCKGWNHRFKMILAWNSFYFLLMFTYLPSLQIWDPGQSRSLLEWQMAMN